MSLLEICKCKPSGKVWTLPMVIFYADVFMGLMRDFIGLQQYVNDQPNDKEWPFGEEFYPFLESRLDAIAGHAIDLGFLVSQHVLDTFKTRCAGRDFSLATLDEHLGMMSNAIEADVRNQTFLCVPAQDRALFEQYEEPFGIDVSLAFGGELDFDISEAARCIALERHTAAVFHLMRVMEAALKLLAKKMNVPLTKKVKGVVTSKEKAWNETVRDIRTKINLRAERTKDQRQWKEDHSALCNHLDGVRLAWRNPTMHPKATYDAHEAREIYQNVKTFIQHLANLEMGLN